MVKDPFELPLEASSIESYLTYRNGEVTTLSFDDNLIHMCYGVDKHGGIWDFCLIDRENSKFFFILDELDTMNCVDAKAIAEDYAKIIIENKRNSGE